MTITSTIASTAAATAWVWNTRRAGAALLCVSMIANRIRTLIAPMYTRTWAAAIERRAEQHVEPGETRERDHHREAAADDVAHRDDEKRGPDHDRREDHEQDVIPGQPDERHGRRDRHVLPVPPLPGSGARVKRAYLWCAWAVPEAPGPLPWAWPPSRAPLPPPFPATEAGRTGSSRPGSSRRPSAIARSAQSRSRRM